DHRFIAGESANRVPHDFAGRLPVAAIEGRLPATSLAFGEKDFDPEMLEHLDRRGGHIVIKRIAKAGRHELDALAMDGSALGVEHEEPERCGAWRRLQPKSRPRPW